MAEQVQTELPKPAFLKNIKTGNHFRYTDILASKAEMMPCDAHGNLTEATAADQARANTVSERAVTPYLGNPNNGALLNYSEILAGRPEMVSINNFKEWEDWKSAHMESAEGQAPNTIAPTLSRKLTDNPAASEETSKIEPIPAGSKLNDVVPTGNEAYPKAIHLPNIEGMGARAAKTVLSDWAKKTFGQSVNRKPALPEVVATCENLIATCTPLKQASGQ